MHKSGMTPELVRQRLYNQQIACTNLTTPGEIVGWLGAVQAQDYASGKGVSISFLNIEFFIGEREWIEAIPHPKDEP
jgi:hypothetical protein